MYDAGTIVAGKYRVEHVLGEGGMGVVVAATHVELGSRVALKFLRPDLARHASVVERFLREARASAQLGSDHICKVVDLGRHTDGIPFIVMELLTGRDLASILRKGGPMPVPLVAGYLLEAAQALAEAHAVGIVHRDLKPGNLFLAQRQNGKQIIKVLDFGVAKAPTGDQDFSLTQTTNVMGSPGYMSPEQIRSSKIVDARSDIWSLGVVMYELVSGKKPFLAETITDLAVRVVTETPAPLPDGLPAGFGAVIARCLEKDPAARYQDAAQLAAALAPFASGGREMASDVAHALQRVTSPTAPPLASEPTIPTTLGSAPGVVTPVPTTSPDVTPRSRAGLIIGLGIGAVAVGIVAVIMMTRPGSSAAELEAGASPQTPELNVNAAKQPPAATPETGTNATSADVAKTTANGADGAKAATTSTNDAKTASSADAAKTATIGTTPSADGAKTANSGDAVKTATAADAAKTTATDAAKTTATDATKTTAKTTATDATKTTATDAAKTTATGVAKTTATDATKATDAAKQPTRAGSAAGSAAPAKQPVKQPAKQPTKKPTLEDLRDLRD